VNASRLIDVIILNDDKRDFGQWCLSSRGFEAASHADSGKSSTPLKERNKTHQPHPKRINNIPWRHVVMPTKKSAPQASSLSTPTPQLKTKTKKMRIIATISGILETKSISLSLTIGILVITFATPYKTRKSITGT